MVDICWPAYGAQGPVMLASHANIPEGETLLSWMVGTQNTRRPEMDRMVPVLREYLVRAYSIETVYPFSDAFVLCQTIVTLLARNSCRNDVLPPTSPHCCRFQSCCTAIVKVRG